jgi:hypothetical protein
MWVNLAMSYYLRMLLSMAVLLVAATYSFGQKSEINVTAYSGLSFFRGSGSATTSWMGSGYNGSSTLNPHSKKPSFFCSFELSGQRVTKNNHLYGIGLAFEALKSTIDIDSAVENAFFYYKYDATGKSTLKNSFITVSPYIGHRLTAGKVLIDLTGGLDLAFSFKGHITGEAVSVDKNYDMSVDYKTKAVVDIRPRLQAKIQYKKAGLLLGYSLGLTEYKNERKTNSYSNIIRLGLSYQLM